ncbi:MAG: CapA family protein [Planctomycetes bacterium]|nr:CapA family protein [Planctomycetota bacterium]
MPDDSILLAAVGDVSFRGTSGDGVDEHGPSYPFEKIRPWLDDADIRFGNMESVFIPDGFPEDRLNPKALASPGRHAAALADAAFDVMNLAANHVLDCGTAGLLNTRQVLASHGIRSFGAGLSPQEARTPLVVEKNGLAVGFLGYQEDCNYTYGHLGAGPAYLVESDVFEDLAALRPDVDVLVLSLHSDLEFMETPAVWRRDLSRRLAAAGADLVLHTHPHVPQGVERCGRSLIAYSLGNCVFNSHTSSYMKDNGPHTAHSFVLRVRLSARGAEDFQRLPFEISSPPERPVPYPEDRLPEALAYLEHLDAALADDAVVLANWRARCMDMLRIYLKRVEGMSAEDFMDRWAWVLAGVRENRSWVSELVRMAEERFRSEASSHKDFLEFNRPSSRYEK